MAIPLYLAKTAAEFSLSKEHPPNLAWMACHFSPYGTGLTNLPSQLPEKTLLILNDRTPVHGHDPIRIKETMEEIILDQNCSGVLLDLQRPNCPETTEIVKALLSLPCPVCVSDLYAKEVDSPVFLPPVPLLSTLEDHLALWQNREIWLEASMQCAAFTVKETGCIYSASQREGDFRFCDERLHCHYRIDVKNDSAIFSINRSMADLTGLLENAGRMGVTKAIRLWQELKDSR